CQRVSEKNWNKSSLPRTHITNGGMDIHPSSWNNATSAWTSNCSKASTYRESSSRSGSTSILLNCSERSFARSNDSLALCKALFTAAVVIPNVSAICLEDQSNTSFKIKTAR